MAVEIREVVGKCAIRQFVEFGNDLYRDCPNFCPHLVFDEMNTFNVKKNPAHEFCEHVLYMAYRDGKPVGRICGIVNPIANERWGVKKVRFGWIDFIDDMEVSKALLDAVAAWGKSKGMTQMNGPVGFTDWDYEGLLIEGFEYLAPMASLYNYPYYEKHLEAYGLTKENDWIEIQLYVPEELPDRVARVDKIARERYNLRVDKVRSARELKKKYGLRTAKEWLEAEYSGAFYMHDAPSCTMKPYCYAYDLSRLAHEGLFFLNDYNNKAPGHLTTFLDDVIEFVSFMSNRSSGACGLPNVLLWTFYFWKKDVAEGYFLKDPDYYIRQSFQKFIYRLNQPFLRVDQSAFVNISIFDKCYYEALFGGVEFPDGTFAIDYIDEFIEHQKIFMEVVSDIRSSNMFTFPVLTYSLLYVDGKFVDEEFARWCSDHNTVWNDSNFFMSESVNTLSNCCRLLSDTSKLEGFINSIGGTALSIGSVKVNTINLMRIALETDSEKKYLNTLKKRTEICCKTLDIVRHIIARNIEKGLLPNYCDGGIEMSKQYCTIGILGLFEVIEYFGYTETDEFGNTSYTDQGIEFASKIFEVLNNVKDVFTDEYSFNIESVPAERAAVILCQKDNLL